jgi:outer membrane protein assembly factor BamB
MKLSTINPLFFFLVLAFAFTAACDKDDVNPDGSGTASWVRERGDNANKGNSAISSGPSKAPSADWTFDTETILKSTPVVADNRVFITGQYEFYALNLKTGAVEWTAPYFGDNATYNDGVLYFGNDDDEFMALDAKTGELLWGVTTPDEVNTSPLVVDGTVFFGDYDNFYALDKTNGDLIWSKYVYGTESSPAYHNGNVLFGNDLGTLYCLDAVTGNEVWTFDIGGGSPAIYSAPAILNDAVYFGDVDGKIYKLNANTGDLIWKYETDGRLGFGSAAVAEDKVYFTCSSTAPSVVPERIVCLDAATGDELWAITFQGPAFSDPVIVGDQVWLGTSTGVYAVNRQTGEQLWGVTQSSGGKASWTTPVVLKGKALIGFSDGNLNLFEF